MMTEPPDGTALVAGLRGVIDMYLKDADLRRAVGETGRVRVDLELYLRKGRVDRSQGAIWFERRIDFGGTDGR